MSNWLSTRASAQEQARRRRGRGRTRRGDARAPHAARLLGHARERRLQPSDLEQRKLCDCRRKGRAVQRGLFAGEELAAKQAEAAVQAPQRRSAWRQAFKRAAPKQVDCRRQMSSSCAGLRRDVLALQPQQRVLCVRWRARLGLRVPLDRCSAVQESPAASEGGKGGQACAGQTRLRDWGRSVRVGCGLLRACNLRGKRREMTWQGAVRPGMRQSSTAPPPARCRPATPAAPCCIPQGCSQASAACPGLLPHP